MAARNENDTVDSEMFFVVGFQRSGTTLLRALLNQSGSVCIPPESSFLTFFWDSFGNWSREFSADRADEFVAKLQRARKIEHWALDWSMLRATIWDERPADYARLILLVYRLYCSSQGKQDCVVGDKNNIHGTQLALIRQLFPSSRIVHVVRDPRDVFASEREVLASAGKEEQDLMPAVAPGAISFGLRWRRYFDEVAKDQILYPDKHLAVIYEDLVRDTPNQLRRIQDFLSLPSSANLSPGRNIPLEPEFQLSWKKNVLKPISQASVGRFKRDNSYLSNIIIGCMLRPYLKWIALRRSPF